MPVSGEVLNSPFVSPLSRKIDHLTIDEFDSIYSIMNDIIDDLDDLALKELTGGYSTDIETVFGVLLDETACVLSTPQLANTGSFDFLERFSRSVEETFRSRSLNYFITSCLPDFLLAPHNIEWGNLIQAFRLLCIIAARDSGKSHHFSFAYILWQMYRYRRWNPQDPNRSKELFYAGEGMLVTNEYRLGTEFLAKIKEEIEANDILRERLLPDSKREGWGKEKIVAKNGSKVYVRSANSKIRGLHPKWFVLDDFLNESSLYSQEQRDRYWNTLLAIIMPALSPGGQGIIVGCVCPDTLIMTKQGLRRIGELNPTDSYIDKKLVELNVDLFGKDGWNTSSHYWINGITKTKKVILTGGYEIEGSLKHPVLIMNEDGEIVWRKLRDLKVGDNIVLQKEVEYEGSTISLIEHKESMKLSKTNREILLDLPDHVDEDLAYLVGLYVAEGYQREQHIEISCTEEPIVSFLMNNKYGVRFKQQEFGVACNSKGLVSLLKYLECNPGICNKKEVPGKILRADKKTLKNFLQGLYDGDGSCSSNGDHLTIDLSSTSEVLIKTVKVILLNVFGIHTLTHRIPVEKLTLANYDQYSLSCHGVQAKKFLKEVGFRLVRKQNKGAQWNGVQKRRIPNQHKLILALKNSRRSISMKERERGISYILETSPKDFKTTTTIRRLITDISPYEPDQSIIDQLEDSMREDRMYLAVREIQDSVSETVDFHIPESHSFITNGIISHNTPFFELDMYGLLKKAYAEALSKGLSQKELEGLFRVFEFPGIYPDGTLLFPQRHNYDNIMAKKELLGPLIFSREILVQPISDDATIFPYSILNKAIRGQGEIDLTPNLDSTRKAFKFVVVGCDFAISSNIGADYSVFTIVGVDEMDRVHVLNCWRKRGKKYSEQIAVLKKINRDFSPDLFVVEINGLQEIFLHELQELGLPVVGDFTGSEKKSFYDGVPSLAILFDNEKIKFPYGTDRAKQMTDTYFSELNSIAFIQDKGKMESTTQHDDTSMSLWQAVKGVRRNIKSFDFSFIN